MSDDGYTQLTEFSTSLGNHSLRVVSKPGLPSWNKAAPSARLIAEEVALPSSAQALFLGCGYGAAAAALAKKTPSCDLWLCDRSIIALHTALETLRLNGVQNARLHQGIDLPPPGPSAFDLAIIDLPKGRKLAQRWLAQAFTALKPGGQLYLAGANNLGIQPVIKDAAELFGAGLLLGYKKGNRISRFTKKEAGFPPTGWWQEPGIAPSTWHAFQVEIPVPSSPEETAPKREILLYSLPGVFSYDRLDDGTRLLIEGMKITSSDAILDLGCGYGVVGLVAALRGVAQVDLLDADLLAVASAAYNLERQRLSHAQALASDVLSAIADRRYTLILSNPPFHTGHSVDFQVAQAFIQQSWKALEKSGRLLIVANRFIRYDRMMESIFRRVEIIATDGHYHLLSGRK
jgi:16S rRNA (guanine1207-N2)-methyltransferase